MDHEVGSWKMAFSMVRLDGPTYEVWFSFFLNSNLTICFVFSFFIFFFTKKSLKTYFIRFFGAIYKVVGPLIGCNLNVDQEIWPCTKSEYAEFIYLFIYVQKGNFKKNQVWPFFVFSCLHLLFHLKKSLKFYYNNMYLPGAFAFFTTTPFLPLPMQNLLDHVSG